MNVRIGRATDSTGVVRTLIAFEPEGVPAKDQMIAYVVDSGMTSGALNGFFIRRWENMHGPVTWYSHVHDGFAVSRGDPVYVETGYAGIVEGMVTSIGPDGWVRVRPSEYPNQVLVVPPHVVFRANK